jgi:hypothetical protein
MCGRVIDSSAQNIGANGPELRADTQTGYFRRPSAADQLMFLKKASM